jgi:hypothetical protein
MPWVIPDGILCDDMIKTQCVNKYTLNAIKTQLIITKNEISERGCDSCTVSLVFDILCSAINHYDHLKGTTREVLADIIHRIYK